MSIQDQLREELNATSTRGNFYRFQEGDNRIRILSEGAPKATHFVNNKPSVCYGIQKGCPFHGDKAPKDDKGQVKQPGIKYVCYILDKVDGQIKLADLPYSVIKKIGEFQLDSEWSFESMPMPYDIKVVYKSKESPANMYSVIQSPKREELSDEILGKLAELLATADPVKLVQDQKEKQMLAHKEQGILLESKLSLEDAQRIHDLRESAQKAQEAQDINIDEIPF